MSKYELLAVVGPTACGKTRRAVELARFLDTEIISGDSRQVYRGMDIGTGKDLEEYGDVPVHLVDILPAGEKYNLHQYLRDFKRVSDEIRSRGRIPILCGGSGMYVEAALNGLLLPEVPENRTLRKSLEGKSLEELTEILSAMKSLHNTTDIDTSKRAIRAIEIEQFYLDHPQEAERAHIGKTQRPNALIIGLDISRELRRDRISRRLRDRLDEGMVEEVETLIQSGIPPENLIYYGLEYKFVTNYILGRLTREEMVRQLEIAIHQFAKRQMTWFRGMETRGHEINWLPYNMSHEDLISFVSERLNK